MRVKSESEVAQSSLTLSDPVDCSLPGFSVHGIFQARGLEWGAIAFPRSMAYTSANVWKITVLFPPTPNIYMAFKILVVYFVLKLLSFFSVSKTYSFLGFTDTLFQQHKRRLYTWTSPDGQHQNQIDYILCSQRWRSSIQSAKNKTRS